ncbi:MAG TPA: hypothetical protein VM925_09085, partial [Labilithrix sp.]|nr:hypothetical protein [Labilithrix sp.]
MLLSHRTNTPGFGAASVSVDRAIAPGFLVRRATLREVVQDERITKPLLGVDSERSRHRIVVVLQGKTCESIDGVEMSLADGQVFFVPAHSVHAGRYGGDVVEIEWDPGALGDGASTWGGSSSPTTLAQAPRRALTRLASSLR